MAEAVTTEEETCSRPSQVCISTPLDISKCVWEVSEWICWGQAIMNVGMVVRVQKKYQSPWFGRKYNPNLMRNIEWGVCIPQKGICSKVSCS